MMIEYHPPPPRLPFPSPWLEMLLAGKFINCIIMAVCASNTNKMTCILSNNAVGRRLICLRTLTGYGRLELRGTDYFPLPLFSVPFKYGYSFTRLKRNAGGPSLDK